MCVICAHMRGLWRASTDARAHAPPSRTHPNTCVNNKVMFSWESGDPDPCPVKWQLFPAPLPSDWSVGNCCRGDGGTAPGDAINAAGTTKLTGQNCMCVCVSVCEAINPVSAGGAGEMPGFSPLMWGFHAWRFGSSLREVG